MRIIALGTTSFLKNCIYGFKESGCSIVGIVSLPKDKLPDNSIDFTTISKEVNAEYIEIEDINSPDFINYLSKLKVDVIFSSWPRLISDEVINCSKYGVIGSHPTSLPKNRGRHPLQWQLILGVKESALTFFWMDSGFDSGPIIHQAHYAISDCDNINTLNDKVNKLAYSSCMEMGKKFLSDNISEGEKQNTDCVNYLRKRDRFDVIIDFRMNSQDILKLIDSFTEPYPCALVIYERSVLHVVKGSIVKLNLLPCFHEPGKIISVQNNTLTIKCADSFLSLITKENIEDIIPKNKGYIFPPSKYFSQYNELNEKVRL